MIFTYVKSYGRNVSSVAPLLKATQVQYLSYGILEGSHACWCTLEIYACLSVCLSFWPVPTEVLHLKRRRLQKKDIILYYMQQLAGRLDLLARL